MVRQRKKRTSNNCTILSSDPLGTQAQQQQHQQQQLDRAPLPTTDWWLSFALPSTSSYTSSSNNNRDQTNTTSTIWTNTGKLNLATSSYQQQQTSVEQLWQQPGTTALVVFHPLFWQFLPAPTTLHGGSTNAPSSQQTNNSAQQQFSPNTTQQFQSQQQQLHLDQVNSLNYHHTIHHSSVHPYSGPASGPAPNYHLFTADCQSREHYSVRRNYTPLTQPQLIGLEEEFKARQHISKAERIEISNALSLSELRVRDWFQNRRKKQRCRETEERLKLLTDSLVDLARLNAPV